MTSIRSRLNASFIPKRNERSFKTKITEKTKVNPYNPALIGKNKYFFNPIIS
jgi:hypothetical protein